MYLPKSIKLAAYNEEGILDLTVSQAGVEGCLGEL